MEANYSASTSSDEEAITLVRNLKKIELSDYRVIGGIVRYSQSARNSMKDVKQRIVASLISRPFGCDNYLLWAPPGSGKSFFVQEIARSMGDAINYREINLAQLDDAKFRQALSEIESLEKPRLVFIDEVDSKPQEAWPYEALLPSLEPPAGKKTVRACFVLAGSSGGSTSGMKEGISKRPKGVDLLSRIPPGNEFEVEGLGLGDRLLVVSTQLLNVAHEEGRDIHEVEKLVLYYVALNPRLKSARNIRQLAIRCMERIPPGEDRIKYDHLFDPGDPENKEFWFRASPVRNELVNLFVSLSESDRVFATTSPESLTPSKIVTEVPPIKTLMKPLLDKNRIAVMPLVNLISDPADDYFADGMTEELISAISLINDLSVISRTSVMSYKKKQSKRTSDIGRELNVGTLLEGSVRKAGNRVRISVQLIDVATDKHLWAQNYDRNLEDVFAIQSDIATKVAESLRSQLLPGKRFKIENANSKNVEAHLLYLKGRDSFFKWTNDALEDALKYFNRAIEIDPNYALAYSALAETYFVLGTNDYLPSREFAPKLEEFAVKASAIDKTLPEVHLALGFSSISKWDIREAEKEWRRSIELNPNLSQPHCYLSCLLFATERFTESKEEAQKALELDPLSSLTCSYAGMAFLFTRNYDMAIEVLEKTTKLDPLNAMAFANLGLAHVKKGLFEKGLEEMKQAIEMEAPSVNAMAHCELAYAYAKSGFDRQPPEILSLLLKGVEQHPGWATAIAGVYSVLGDKEKAFMWLEKARDVHSGYLPWIGPEPAFDNIRSDPRFGIFLSKIGLRDPSQIDLLQEVQSAKTKSQEKTGTAKLDSRRIAVLPFTNISPDPKDEFFADGMTEELISTLSRIRELKVISRTSVMRYKQTEKSLSEIASDLNVNAVLEGSVRKMGDDLRITAQLIDVQNDEHLWSEDYDRKFENVFSLQREIALRVADSLKVSILSKESKELGKKPTQNMEAYVLYLKGRAYSYQMTIESFRKAIGYWEQAIQKDPNYAQAFASMAGVYILMGTSGLLPMSETFPKAQWFTEKAMQLDPSIPDSHAARGWVLFNQWDFRGAEIEIRRAVELGPNVVDGHLDLANLFAGLGRFDDCALECNRALELDPLSDITCTMVGILLTTAHYYDEAIEVLKNAIELDPNSAIARHNLGVAYVMKGMIEEGISEIKAVLETSKEKVANWMSDLAWAYAQAGNINEVRKILADLLRMNEQGHASETEIACVYVSLGEKDKAMEWLEKAFERHSGYLAWGLNADASFDNLRSDPKFQALRKKIGFPDVGSASS